MSCAAEHSHFRRGVAFFIAGRVGRALREFRPALLEPGLCAQWACQQLVQACLQFEGSVERLMRPLRAAAAAADPRADLYLFDVALARRLEARLVAPALACLPDGLEWLAIVPDGPLHSLPLELLVTGQHKTWPRALPPLVRFDEPRYLADTHVVSYAPASQLVPQSRLDRPLSRLLAVGYSPVGRPTLMTPEGPRKLPPLPGVEAELQAIRGPFAQAQLLEGGEATVANLEACLKGHDVLHIAAHALADSRAPGLSGVVLAPEDGNAAFDYLTAERIREWRIRGRLVTLSACDSGHGRLRAGEGLLGLARAFLEAGAESVVASLWPVDDGATRRLMAVFYEGLARGESVAGALTAAKRTVRTACERHLFPTLAHPYIWAIDGSWFALGVLGCIEDPSAPPRNVVEVSFCDSSGPAYYLIASVVDPPGIFFNYDAVRGASGPDGNIVPVSQVPVPEPLTSLAEDRGDGFAAIEIELSGATPSYSELGADAFPHVRGIEILYRHTEADPTPTCDIGLGPVLEPSRTPRVRRPRRPSSAPPARRSAVR